MRCARGERNSPVRNETEDILPSSSSCRPLERARAHLVLLGGSTDTASKIVLAQLKRDCNKKTPLQRRPVYSLVPLHSSYSFEARYGTFSHRRQTPASSRVVKVTPSKGLRRRKVGEVA